MHSLLNVDDEGSQPIGAFPVLAASTDVLSPDVKVPEYFTGYPMYGEKRIDWWRPLEEEPID